MLFNMFNILCYYLFNNLFSISLYLLLISFVLHIYNNFLNRRQLPSGPFGLPIVGYLPFLGSAPHKKIAKLGQKYGNVFTLQLGVHNVVVLNDVEAVKDALNNDQCLGRPHETPFTTMSNNYSFSDESGYVWREHRKFAMKMFRDIGFGTGSMNDRIVEEILHLIRLIDGTNGKPLDISKLLTPSMSNNIFQLVFGHRFEFNDHKRQLLDKTLTLMNQRLSHVGLISVSPLWLSKLILKFGGLGKKNILKPVLDMFSDEISNHKKTNNGNERDYIEAYLEEMEMKRKKDPDTSFTENKLLANCRSLFGAGSLTVRTTAEWVLLFVAHFPQYQKIIREEIDSVVGKERLPVWKDKEDMLFTQAFIKEIFRLKTTIPLNVMRTSLADTTILGHFIPKNTNIIANLWAVHNNPRIWKDPDQFNPNRFLSNDGKHVINTEALLPFSTGKRSCPGEALARVEIFLYLTILLQRYIISTSDDKTTAFEEDFGFTLQPKNKPILTFVKRL